MSIISLLTYKCARESRKCVNMLYFAFLFNYERRNWLYVYQCMSFIEIDMAVCKTCEIFKFCCFLNSAFKNKIFTFQHLFIYYTTLFAGCFVIKFI